MTGDELIIVYRAAIHRKIDEALFSLLTSRSELCWTAAEIIKSLLLELHAPSNSTKERPNEPCMEEDKP